MAKKRTFNQKRRKNNLKFLFSILFVLVLASAYHVLSSKAMDDEMLKIDSEISSTQRKLDDINNEIVSLESDYEIRNTDEFKEKIAEERLGMVKEDKDEGN